MYLIGMQTDTSNNERTIQERLEESQALVLTLDESLRQAEGTIRSLKSQVAYLQGLVFGRKSERVVCDPSLSPMLPGMEEAGRDAVQEEAGKTQTVAPHERKVAEKPDRKGWLSFPDTLPRETVDITLPPEQTEGMTIIGYAESERLVHRSEYVVQVVRRAKYACPKQPLKGVLVAPCPENPLALDSNRAHYDVSVFAHALAEKFVNHMPFYRQSKDLDRQGIRLDRGVMCEAALAIARSLQPLCARMEELLMGEPVIHADETPVRMLDPGGGKCRLGYIWIRMSDSSPRITVFHFSEHRNRDTANRLLGDYRGTFVSDGYAGYAQLSDHRAICWAHARRKFHQALPLSDERRNRILRIIRQIYDNERTAADNAVKCGGEAALLNCRRTVRQKTRLLVAEYFRLCREIVGAEPPSSPLAKAAAYSLNLQEGLEKFLSDPQIPLDNNPAENAIRPIALGRKNWMFVGNAESGSLTAVIYSLVSTCENRGIYFEAWLKDVLARLPHTPANDIDSLLPMTWEPKADGKQADEN